VVGRLAPAERERLAPFILERAFRKGDVLQEQECMSEQLRIVKIGTTLLLRRGISGQRSVIAVSGRGQTLGVLALLGAREILDCHGASAGRLCEVGLEAVRRQGLADDRFLLALAAQEVAALARMADWAQLVHLRSMHRRLLVALRLLAAEQGSSCVRIPSRTLLAELLGTTRETVTRSLGTLVRARDVVRRDRWHYEVRDMGEVRDLGEARVDALPGGPPERSASS
jgi:CRP-like cAMP-binding protein